MYSAGWDSFNDAAVISSCCAAYNSGEYIDAKSGVSARMTISAMENLISAAERRCLKNGLKKNQRALI